MLAQADGLRAVTRAEIVAAARSWLGTPYRHQASVKGVGCDCLGLVRGVWRELYGCEPEGAPAYRADWAEVSGEETLLEAARRHLVERALPEFALGDVVLFRMAPEACVKHAAVVSAVEASEPEARIVHAYWGRAAVESWLGPWWRRRLVARFEFPGVAG
ncbi:MAG TPA: peptidase P60 [Caulobacteraceae bacterium]|jgi:NlpC/P60 family putative phage cell wall peptidase